MKTRGTRCRVLRLPILRETESLVMVGNSHAGWIYDNLLTAVQSSPAMW
jgi:hypothetical protein